ncbi:MAG: VWA domain-containing protein [Meiothermus sp.]|nr:VWA domain-containing protein [Meiothermus sp.]
MERPVLELVPIRRGLRRDRATELAVMLRVTSPRPLAPAGRPHMNLALVLDRSGSMNGTKLEQAKAAALFAVDNLLPEDRVALVTYDDQVEVLAPSAPVEGRAALAERLRAVRAGGSTDLHGGWLEGARQVAAHLDPGRLNRVILLTDGLANVGERDPRVIADHVRGLAERGVSTTALGVGLDYNEDLLVAMAEAGGGNYQFIEHAADLPRVFARELAGLAGTFGTSARLELSPAPGVVAELANGLPVDAAGSYLLPDLVWGAPLELLLRLTVPPGVDRPLALRLSWRSAGGEPGNMEDALELPAVDEAGWERLPEDQDVAALEAKIEATRAREAAMAALANGDINSAREALAAAAPITANFCRLHDETEELYGLLGEVGQAPDAARKRMSSQVFRNRKGSG